MIHKYLEYGQLNQSLLNNVVTEHAQRDLSFGHCDEPEQSTYFPDYFPDYFVPVADATASSAALASKTAKSSADF